MSVTSPANRRAVIVGLFIFIGIIGLIAGVMTIGNLHSSFIRKISIKAIFDDINGLKLGNNVWYSGVKIGTVTNITFYGESQVEVIVKVDKKAQPFIHTDAKVKISNEGVIGDKLLVIYGGTKSAPLINDGDVLSVEKMISTEEMLNTLQKNNTNLLEITDNFKAISGQLRDGRGSIGKLLQDETLYTNMEGAIGSLQQASTQIKQLSGSLASYSAKLTQEGGLANDLVSDTMVFHSLRATAGQLEDVVRGASALTDNLNKLSSDLNKDLNSSDNLSGVLLRDSVAANNLKSIIQNMDSSSYKLNENLEALKHNFLFRRYFKKQQKAANKQ